MPVEPNSRGTVLITGGLGRLSRALIPELAGTGWRVVAPGRSDLDITDREAVLAGVARLRPDAVVNAAAMRDVDRCEAEPVAAFAVNATAVGTLAEACGEVGARLCQISTDYVFSGHQPSPATEDDETEPILAYGRQKLAGEALAGPQALIIRTAWLCSPWGRNIVPLVLDQALSSGRVLRFIDDQWGSPTAVADLASMIARLVADEQRGVFHVTNTGRATWFEVAQHVLEVAGFDPSRVEPIPSTELVPPQVRRPTDTALISTRLGPAGYAPLRPWREAVADVVEQYLAVRSSG